MIYNVLICALLFHDRARHLANGIFSSTTWFTYTKRYTAISPHSLSMKKASTSKSTAKAGSSSSTPQLNISCQNVIINVHAPDAAPPATKKTNSANSTLKKSVAPPVAPKRNAIKSPNNPRATDQTSLPIASARRSQQRQQQAQQQRPISVPMQIDHHHRHQSNHQMVPHMSNVTTHRSSAFRPSDRFDAPYSSSSSQTSFLQRSSMLGLERYHPYTVNGDAVQFARRTDYYSSNTFFGDGYEYEY